MKMKIMITLTFILICLFGIFVGINKALILSFMIIVTFGVITTIASIKLKLPFYHDFPNVLRMLLTIVGSMLMLYKSYIIGMSLFILAIILNDEWQRRIFRRFFPKKPLYTIALLGIDGSGKTTHVLETAKFLQKQGFKVKIVPFNKYIFLDKLAISIRRKRVTAKTIKGTYTVKITPLRALRPWLAFIDNLLLFTISSALAVFKNYIVLYDRFLWSTFIKYEALGYPILPLKKFMSLIRPSYAIILDITADESYKKILSRPKHLRYPKHVLEYERLKYLEIANTYNYPVINSLESFETVQHKINTILKSLIKN